jgi:hypothetical protein
MRLLSWLFNRQGDDNTGPDEAHLSRLVDCHGDAELDLYHSLLRENRPRVVAMRQAINDALVAARG